MPLQLLLVVAAALSLILGGCAGRSAGPALTAPPAIPATTGIRLPSPMSTDITGTVPLSSVTVKPVCAPEYGFCAGFPYVEAHSEYRAEQRTPEPGMAWEPYVFYSVNFEWTYLNGEFRLCRPGMQACVPGDWVNNGGFFDQYEITIAGAANDSDVCGSYADRRTENVVFAGVEAIRSTCAMVKPNQGKQIVVSFSHKGLYFTLSAANTRLDPFFSKQFFDSFALTGAASATPRPTPTPTPGKADLAKVAGTWRVHGESVVLNEDGTGTDVWNVGPCNNDELCTAHATLRLEAAPDGVKATYVDITVQDSTGEPAQDIGGEAARAGKSYLITYLRPGLLERRALGDLEPFSNPYLCNDETSAQDEQKC